MAKWGEGDPRWIVEERADATNVNNWHWTEKNATPWSKDKLKSLLEGLVIEDDAYHCQIKDITKIEGEASANNRKAKLFFFYEWEIKAEWTGKFKSGGDMCKGEIEIPNLSEEHTADSVDINVSLKENQNDEGAYKIKEFIRNKGLQVIRRQLHNYIKELKEEFSQGMILPTKDQSAPDLVSKNKVTNYQAEVDTCTNSSSSNKHWIEVQGGCKTYDETVDFKCTVDEIFTVFVDRQKLEAFSRGPVEVDARIGGKFSLFGGNITGEFTNLLPYERIEMKWRSKTWPSPHHSSVVLQFDQKDDCTYVTLHQSGIPGSDYERTVEGWKHYYWFSIKQTFGFGAMLF
ncbi:hypothetical protein HELRODRAFT_89741 [Helobdella robusta]|uniref:Activator of Hsp90 ATPase AHSA1-like N-terminal domain-containing protein n=1 Tax=Helobdella robusta TaxID=6412 RepID=T1G7H0_HELRO|nr:hypothetical protein HELRODRAFT_89741 [Helobdella robusta]ESN92278.1 hypothetical protein HELRODRAFT_89741 [Helobdella robusta]